jgi:hypothetical protein
MSVQGVQIASRNSQLTYTTDPIFLLEYDDNC